MASSSLLEKVIDLSLLERLKKSSTTHLLFNTGLYLATVMPLLENTQLPDMAGPWEHVPTLILAVFIFAGFGILSYPAGKSQYYLSYAWDNSIDFVRFSLHKLFGIEIKPKDEKFLRDDRFSHYILIGSYLRTHDDPVIQKQYDKVVQAIQYGYTSKDSATETLILLLLWRQLNGWLFNETSKIFWMISQKLSLSIDPFWIICAILLIWAARPLPPSMEYIRVPNGKDLTRR